MPADAFDDEFASLCHDPEDVESDYGRGLAAGYARAVDLIRAEAKRADSKLSLVALEVVADFLEAHRG